MPGAEESASTLKMNEAIKDSSCLQRFVIPPGSTAQLFLSLISSFLIIWDLITIPLELFDLPDFYSFLVVFGKVSFGFWTVNIPLQFILGVEVQGKMEVRPPVLARLYLQSWFAMDVLVVSLDAVLILLEDREAGSLKSARLLRTLRLLRLVRLLRVARLQHQLTLLANRFLSANSFMVMKVVAGLCGILAVNHIIACIWYGLGSWSIDGRSWIVRMEMEQAGALDFYATSIHWALTQFTPATNNVAPENAVERIFAIIVILLAMGMFSSFISALTSTVSAYRNARMEQFNQQSMLLRFFTERNLSTDLYGKIREVIQKERHAGIRLKEDEVMLLQKVPEGLKFQLHEEMFLSHVGRLPFWPAWSHFEDQHFFRNLCHGAMTERVTTKGHDAFTPEGDCLEVCVLEAGCMSYEPAEGAHARRAREGSIFCMPALWAEWQYRGRLSARYGTCYHIGLDTAMFCRLAAQAGGPLWQFLQIFGFLLVSSIEALDEQGEIVTDLCLEEAKISELVSRTQRYSNSIHERGGLFHSASARGGVVSPQIPHILLQKVHDVRQSEVGDKKGDGTAAAAASALIAAAAVMVAAAVVVVNRMSRTASLMLVDMDELFAEAEAEESHVNELEELERERERLNAQQRRVASTTLIEEMAKITDYADPSHTVMLQGFNWESHKAGKGNWYGIVESKVDMFADMGITDIWLPPCSQSVAPQGYLPSQLFNLDASAYGKKAALKSLLSKLHSKGMRGVADIVINHRCGDKQDHEGRWNVFTSTGIESRQSFHGIMDWQGWAITLGDKFSDGTGERGPGHYDGKFDAAPDIDHGNKKVQNSIAVWLRWLRLDIGFDAWRFDFVKGYGAEFVGHYCKKSHPSWAVGELWLDMEYDHEGLKYNQDKHRQDTVNWINGTDKEHLG
ncbi:AMY1.6 [Symbiodinium pilosum]|uniref:AMY1.6 protein n=1 Tax=Symbiodinium pilosum TaxID=2952 RepID=A0A812WL02_SYMPI|nr:AMY1.6 [Symbiodinium pilosum]